MASNFAPGAAYKHRKTLSGLIPSYTIPDIPENSIIIGVCGVSSTTDALIEYKDGWFMSDFCAMNYLLKGIGTKQTWVTASSEASFLHFFDAHPEFQPGFLHGNPYQDRKVVFSKSLIENDELTPFTVCNEALVVETFLEEIKEAIRLAKATTPPCPIVLFIFGHGTESLGVFLDYTKPTEDPKALLMLENIEALMQPDVPVTTITTACFSGGWAIQQDVNMTISTAAGAWECPSLKPDGGVSDTFLSKSWNSSDSVGRHCGSIFATTLVNSLCSSTSPLLAKNSSAGEASNRDSVSLQPKAPTSLQAKTYNEFCRTIADTLKNTTRLADQHEFRFAAQDDEWAKSFMSRMGVPLGHFQARWERLPIYPSTMPNNFTNQDPHNVYDPTLCSDAAAPSISGRCSQVGSLCARRSAFDSLRLLGANNRHLRLAAARLSSSCPGDWEIGPNVRLKGQFQRYARTGTITPPGESKESLERIISFRIQLAHYVDNVVEFYHLSKSQGKPLLDWDRWWYYSYGSNVTNTERFRNISRVMCENGLSLDEGSGQGAGFGRGHLYLAECICISELVLAEAFALIQKIGARHKQYATRFEEEIVRSRSLRHQGGIWLRAVGRNVRSLSPAKKRLGQLEC